MTELEEENKALSDANLRLSQAQGRGHGNEGGDSKNNNGEEGHHAADGVGVADDPAAPFVVPGDRQGNAAFTLLACFFGCRVTGFMRVSESDRSDGMASLGTRNVLPSCAWVCCARCDDHREISGFL